MLDRMQEYLDSVTTTVLSDLIMDATRTLTQTGQDVHHYQLQQAMDIAEGLDPSDAVESLQSVLLSNFREVLKQFGVYITEDTDLRTANSILKGITLIEDWDDPATLNGLTAALEGEEAALADILQIVGELTIGDYMNALDRVSPDLIVRIGELTSRDTSEPQPDSVAVAGAQMRLRELLNKGVLGEDSLFVHAMDMGMRLGLSFELAIQPYLEELYQRPVGKLAPDLVAFAYASALATDEIPDKLNRLKESFHLSITDLLELDSAIKKLL